MLRFLTGSDLTFTKEICEWLEDYIDTNGPTERILIHLIDGGIRLRNLDHSRSMTMTASGALATITYIIDKVDDSQVWRAIDEVDAIGEDIVSFFKN